MGREKANSYSAHLGGFRLRDNHYERIAMVILKICRKGVNGVPHVKPVEEAILKQPSVH